MSEATASVTLDELDLHAVTLLDHVFGLLGAAVAHLGDVEQTLGAGHDFHESSESGRTLDRAFVCRADFGLGGNCLNHLPRAFHRLAANRCDRHKPAVVDADLGPSLFLDSANRLALGSDQFADLLRIDRHRHDARCVLGEFRPHAWERLVHLAEYVNPSDARLRHRFLHDLEVESLDLDIHLDRRDSLLRPRDLEIHVAEVILGTENVGQDRVTLSFLDQTHRHAGDW